MANREGILMPPACPGRLGLTPKGRGVDVAAVDVGGAYSVVEMNRTHWPSVSDLCNRCMC